MLSGLFDIDNNRKPGESLAQEVSFMVFGPSSIPGLRGRFAPPLGACSGGAWIQKRGRKSPLQKTTSAAYGVGHHSIADVTAVGARCRPSSHRWLGWEFCLVKRGRTRHARFGILGGVGFVLRLWLFGCCRGRG